MVILARTLRIRALWRLPFVFGRLTNDFDAAKQTFTRHVIAQAPSGKGPGIGLQIRIADIDGNGWKDIVVPGKSGTYILWNEGRGAASK